MSFSKLKSDALDGSELVVSISTKLSTWLEHHPCTWGASAAGKASVFPAS